ncbi:uncharacterized protein LOC123866183 [Maniola jurtina]|uniref:uncharacterized protein LOC123866183 n=1 Tax=Maniola jurtina TaxID=191418 RepID=UPI001E68C7E8|nr:uncharacterized protein LOC123866183 [Maniola jurtina]XP_045763538.1 uncharacterized protein LOC123866183 [Maniola jurtina]XP_045763539.1 uncharacterized protein LOC123866183 [Maniola jurtina]
MPRHDMENIQVIRKAVKLYETNRCLWDPKQKHYFNKISREIIWRRISAEVNIPVPEVKKKLTSLLGSYRREKSRENKSKLRSGTGKVYKSKWFAYPWFTFLTNKNIPSNTEDSICDETPDTSETNADQNNEDSSYIEFQDIQDRTDTNPEDYNESSSFQDSTIKSKCMKTSKLQDVKLESPKSQNVMVAPWAKSKIRKRRLNATVTSKCSNSNVDHFTSFGNHIANELRKYDEHLVPHIKKAILDIVFQADTGQFPVQHSYAYTSGYHTSSPSTDPIASPPHVQREESSDSTLQQNMDFDLDEQKASLLE